MENILNITAPVERGEIIEEYKYHEYEPITGTNLNNPGEIRINIETQDIFTHPSESYLIVEGRLTKNDGAAYADADAVTLVNNGIMHLFRDTRYQLSGQEIESVLYPGQTTTMLGLLKYPGDFSKSQGLNQLWFKNTDTTAVIANNTGFAARQKYIIQLPDPKGTFSFKIPLKHIFGFAEDYDKVVYGFKHTLTLTRDSNDNAIFRHSDADAGKVTLSKVSWFMPHIMPADAPKFQLYKNIENKAQLEVGFRMRQSDSITVPQTTNFTWRLGVKSSAEKPRYIIVGFQTNKSGDQETNPSLFDNLNTINIYAMLNSTRHPLIDSNTSFKMYQFSRLYGDAAAFRSKFYDLDELVGNPSISPADYATLHTLFFLDVSKQSERLKNSVTDIQIKAQFGANAPANTQAYALVISDRLIKFISDGNKMSVVY
ncbi:uncharacterized protein [Watersipora subatra]|uniref:uncharacterized protein n=1 Tax=Watersipora subatra TaxID=2589382 RepID=UPI00355B6046